MDSRPKGWTVRKAFIAPPHCEPKFGEWQDIATAPADGRLILVTGGSRHGRNVKAVEADGAWWRYESRLKALPTHWMPLPPPPGE